MGKHSRLNAGTPYTPTDEHRRSVMTMTGFGIRQEEMCAMLKISKPTLHKHFRHELDTGMTEANMRVVQSLYTNATKHMSVQAQIWWTKARMGWKDTSELAIGGTETPLMIVTGVIRDGDFTEAETESAGTQRQIGVYDPPAGSAD